LRRGEDFLEQRVDEINQPDDPHASLGSLLVSFLKLGASSFGGGMAAWTYREIVERRGWMTDENFLQTQTIAQILPGANPVNLAVYIGLKLRGLPGAIIAAFAMVAPAFTVIILLSTVYRQLSDYPETHSVLRGLACVGIASTLTMGMKTARRLHGQTLPILIALSVFIMVGVLRWPLVPVVFASIPPSVLVSYLLSRDKKHG